MTARRRGRPWQSDDDFDPDQLKRELDGAETGARRKQCHGKVAHANRVAAEAAAAEDEREHGGSMTAYECRWCGRWHVGRAGGR